MKQLLIANKGLLEVEALTLLGASSKREDLSKIGKFGSGNKYALAYFLRHGYQVKIFSGKDEIILGLNRKTFREHDFDVITVNGAETSITTEFGHEWTLWQAVRELYSNAVDEGLLHFGFSEIDGMDYDQRLIDYCSDKGNSVTEIQIGVTPEIEDLMFNIRDYIATGNEVLFECEYGKIYRKHNNTACIYYRGIKCFETKKESVYDYDFNHATINEQRLLAYAWTLPQEMWKLLFKCGDARVIRQLLQEIQEVKFLENDIDNDFVSIFTDPDETGWKEALDSNLICPRNLGGYVPEEDRAKTLFLPGKLYNSLIGVIGNTIKTTAFTVSKGGKPYRKIELDPLQSQLLLEVMKFFDECRFKIPYKVIPVDFDDKNVLGSITEDNEILLGLNLFSQGKHQIVNTMIEEFIHIKYNVGDETRGFQNSVIDEFVTYMKTVNAYTL